MPVSTGQDHRLRRPREAHLLGPGARFEARWVRFNVLRALLSTGALACLAWALVLNGRS
ncbi:hypothetical protein ACIQOW_30550 [Kitasatospora sp. NPDC091335]|uniref:hypothetical protein n=1 Tax=Kitasatospora sp. NPDC091335 TaxID=3364085 RepID=UPI0037FB83BC